MVQVTVSGLYAQLHIAVLLLLWCSPVGLALRQLLSSPLARALRALPLFDALLLQRALQQLWRQVCSVVRVAPQHKPIQLHQLLVRVAAIAQVHLLAWSVAAKPAQRGSSRARRQALTRQRAAPGMPAHRTALAAAAHLRRAMMW